MSSIVYPLPPPDELITIHRGELLEKKLVIINSKPDDSCVHHKILESVSREYQNIKNPDGRVEFLDHFLKEMRSFLKEEGQSSSQEIYDKFMTVFQNSQLNEKFSLASSSGEDSIFNLVITKKDTDNSELNTKTGFHLFSQETKRTLWDNSNLFHLLNKDFIHDMIKQRIIIRTYKERIKYLKDHEDMEKAEEMKEILNFNMMKENSLEPCNLLGLLKSESCEREELTVRFYSQILQVNIYITRAWKCEVSVINLYHYSMKASSIILFKFDGRVSLTGKEMIDVYLPGGLIYKNAIKTVLTMDKDEDLINRLEKIHAKDCDQYYMDLYTTYLKKSDDRIVISIDDSTKEIELESDIEEENSSEKKDEDSEDSEETPELPAEKDQKLESPGNIPSFIQKMDLESLKSVLKYFCIPVHDKTSKKEMEISFFNLVNSYDTNVDNIIHELENKSV